MVDASAMDTVCVKVKNKKDMEYVLSHLHEDSLHVAKDLNYNYEFVEEGRSLAMIEEEVCVSRKDFLRQIGKRVVTEDGTYRPVVSLAFINMPSVGKACKELALKIGANDKERKKKNGEEDEDDVEIEEVEDLDLGGKQSYYYNDPKRKWVEPEVTGEDSRTGEAGVVTGGAPAHLETLDTPVFKPKPKKDEFRPVKSYSTGEIDERKGIQKVYIEDPEVVNSDESNISFKFLQFAYTLRVEVPGNTPLVLGPVDCGHINPDASTWKLSKGKRLTVTLVRANKADVKPWPKKAKEPSPDESVSDGSGDMMMVVGMIVVALLAAALAMGLGRSS